MLPTVFYHLLLKAWRSMSVRFMKILKNKSAVSVTNPSRSAVEDVFSKTYNLFSDLNTNSKWSKYFTEKWGVVEPVEIHLGVRYDSKRNKVSGRYEQVQVNDTFIYVPLLKIPVYFEK